MLLNVVTYHNFLAFLIDDAFDSSDSIPSTASVAAWAPIVDLPSEKKGGKN